MKVKEKLQNKWRQGVNQAMNAVSGKKADIQAKLADNQERKADIQVIKTDVHN